MGRVRRIGHGASVVLAASAGLLAGCVARPYDTAVNTGLERLAANRPIAEAPPRMAAQPTQMPKGLDVEQFARDLQALLESANALEDSSPAVHAAPPAPTVAAELSVEEIVEPQSLHISEPDDVLMFAADDDTPMESPADDVEASVSLDVRIARAAAGLRDMLRERSSGSLDPVRDEAVASIVDLLCESPRATSRDELAPSERDAVAALKEFVMGMLAWSRGEEADPAALAQRMADRLAATHGVRIREAALCTRVAGFGQFTPVTSTRLLAGRSHRLFLYTEIERFARRAVTPSEADPSEWAVEISQELNLWHDAPTPILAWRRAEERVVETFRGPKRDFYLVHPIELPRTLTVGAYVLKVIVRDKVSGAQAEAAIPIHIVADPGLVRGGS